MFHDLRPVQVKLTYMMRRIWLAETMRLVLLFCLMCTLPFAISAQSSSGTVIGIVTDQSGAIVSRASVTLTRVDTSTKTKTVTDDSGRYQFVNITPGPYQVDVDAPGFKHFTRTSIDVQVATSVRIDASLPIGAASEVVEVTTESPLLDVQTATVGQVVEGRTVQETPLNGRNVMNLLTVAPGVVAQGSTEGAVQGNQNGGGHTNNAAFGNYQIGGGTAGQSAQFLDGVPLNILGSNTVALIPTQDAVQEFRVDINGVSPQYGRFAGGVVTITSKSGANQFHGVAYEYLRNTILDANNYFTKQAGQARPGLHQNQYGFTLGGPIRRNKLFFFGSLDRYHFTQGYPFQTNVPTLAQRQGDFSSELGQPLPIINPCTGMPVQVGQIFDPYSTKTVNGQVCRTPFYQNKIDPTRFDKTANYILNTAQYFPAPNTSSSAGNFYSTTPVGGQSSQYNIRGDYAASTKQNLFARYSYFGLNDLSQNVFNNLTGNPPSHDRTQQGVVGDTYLFSPTTVLDMRVSYTRNYYDNAATTINTNLSQFGPAYASLQSQVSFPELPEVLLGPTLVPPQDDDFLMDFEDVTSFQWTNSYVVSANISKLLGKHSLNFGADLRRLENNTTGQSTTPSGSFSFLGTFTSFNNNLPPTGDKVADLLLGTPETGVLSTVHSVAQFEYYQGYYLNDIWQVTPKLTINGGLRWEIPGVYHERHNLGTVLQPNATDPLNVTGYNLKGQLALVASPQYSATGTLDEHFGLFAPRLGVAYQVDPKTAFRAAYGITYPPSDLFTGASPSASQVNSATTTMVTSVNGGLTPYNTLSSPFPANGTVGNTAQTVNEPTGRSAGGLTALEGQTISGPTPGQRYSYTQQYNVNMERQFGQRASLQIGYLGSKGTFLPLNAGTVGLGLDQLPDQYDSRGNALLNQVANPFAGKVSNLSSLNGATVTAGQLLRPYPQFTNVVNTTPFLGASTYNSLQVQSQVRLGGGGTIISSYTWAKLLSNTDTLNSYLESGTVGSVQDYTNLRPEKSLSTFNVEHRFVTTYIADLPFGRGRLFLNNLNGGLDRIVGGWGFNGITTFQTGFPLAITAQANSLSNYFGAGTIRPNIVPGCNANPQASSQQKAATTWFNTACFTQPADFTFGNENRVDPSLRAAGIANWDAAVFKKTQIRDRINLELRMEVFNLFNRVQFGSPGTQIGGHGVGTVSSTANSPRVAQIAGKVTF